MRKLIAILFVLLFTPILAFGAVDLATDEDCDDKNSIICNSTPGCMYSGFCKLSSYENYNSGDGVKPCTNKPLGANYYDGSVGHKKNDCAWTLRCSRGTYWDPWTYNPLRDNSSNNCCVACPQGYISSGYNAQVTYLGDEKQGSMGISVLPTATKDTDCRECPKGTWAKNDMCNWIIVYDSGDSIPVTQYEVNDSFFAKSNVKIYSRGTSTLPKASDFGYSMVSTGYEFSGWQCFAFEPTKDHGSTYEQVNNMMLDGAVVSSAYGSNIPTSYGFYKCTPLYNKPCEAGYYCTESGKTKCPTGLTTNVTDCEPDYVNSNFCDAGAQSVDECGVKAGVTVFEDSKGTFKLPGTWFAYPAK